MTGVAVARTEWTEQINVRSERMGEKVNGVLDVKRALEAIREGGDDRLDEVTLTIIEAVLRRARFSGWSDAELQGYLDYRKRMATARGDRLQRERIVRVKQALVGERWGLRAAVAWLRSAYYRNEADRTATRIEEEERLAENDPAAVFEEEIAEKASMAKRSGGGGGRRRKKAKPTPLRAYEWDREGFEGKS